MTYPSPKELAKEKERAVIEELEKSFTEPEEEWLPTCGIVINWSVTGTTRGDHCGKPAKVNAVTKRPFCGPKTLNSYCETHMTEVLAGKTCCVVCSQKAQTLIRVSLVRATWKSD